MSENEKTKAKFTAGPWDVRSNLGGLAEVAVKGGARIAEVWTTCNSEQNREANACLIAAAPLLLAACEKAEREIAAGADGDVLPPVLRDLRAAIAKARGK